MATDLHDANLQMSRKARWAKAFSDDSTTMGTIQARSRRTARGHTKSVDGTMRNKGGEKPDAPSSGGGMLAALRKAASGASKDFTGKPTDDLNRKATVVLEHLLQAADIMHCMQNWKIYLKWNERLFDENYEAYEAGRIKNNPAETWYQGEV